MGMNPNGPVPTNRIPIGAPFYVRVTDETISGFWGEYEFLSNFYLSDVSYEGFVYNCVETAYHAQKVTVDYRCLFCEMNPDEARTAWKLYPTADEDGTSWNMRKDDIMLTLLFTKFINTTPISRNWVEDTTLRRKLADTGDKHLVYATDIEDRYWGIHVKNKNGMDVAVGSNKLGDMLEGLRKMWRTIDKLDPRFVELD